MPERGRCFSMGKATLSGPVAVEEKGWRQPQEVQRRKKESRRTSETPPARGMAELREVASGSATQGLWLRNGKVRSQVSGVDQRRFPGRRTVREIRREGRRGRRARDRVEKKVYSFGV